MSGFSRTGQCQSGADCTQLLSWAHRWKSPTGSGPVMNHSVPRHGSISGVRKSRQHSVLRISKYQWYHFGLQGQMVPKTHYLSLVTFPFSNLIYFASSRRVLCVIIHPKIVPFLFPAATIYRKRFSGLSGNQGERVVSGIVCNACKLWAYTIYCGFPALCLSTTSWIY